MMHLGGRRVQAIHLAQQDCGHPQLFFFVTRWIPGFADTRQHSMRGSTALTSSGFSQYCSLAEKAKQL